MSNPGDDGPQEPVYSMGAEPTEDETSARILQFSTKAAEIEGRDPSAEGWSVLSPGEGDEDEEDDEEDDQVEEIKAKIGRPKGATNKMKSGRFQNIGLPPKDIYNRAKSLARQYVAQSEIKSIAGKQALAEQLACLVILRRIGFELIANGKLDNNGFRQFTAICANILKLTLALGLATIPEDEGDAMPWNKEQRRQKDDET